MSKRVQNYLSLGVAVALFSSSILLAVISLTVKVHASDSYPYSAAVDCSKTYGSYTWCMPGDDYLSPNGYAFKNCTDYAAWKIKSTILGRSPIGLGNANTWDDRATSKGFALKTTAEYGDVAVWNTGSYGHVAFVESVNANGTVNVSEYNYSLRGGYSTRTGVRADAYIDFNGVNTVHMTQTPKARGISGIHFLVDSDVPIAADWNGDGQTDIGVVRGNTFYQRVNNSYTHSVSFGNGIAAGDIPIKGNWTGDKREEIGVVREGIFYLRHSSSKTVAIGFGNGIAAGDIPVVGDWDGDGYDEVGIVRGNVFYQRKRGGGVLKQIGFGDGYKQGDIPLVMDWDRDGIDDPTIARGTYFYGLRSTDGGTSIGAYGNGLVYGDIPIVGDWDGFGGEDLGVVRGDKFYLSTLGVLHYGNGVQASY